MRKTILLLLKLCISTLLALTILSGLCLFYYNPPITVPQPDGYTNHRFEPNSFWVNMTEGGGWGHINDLGYSDRNNYDPNAPTIAFLGSSQVQAMQVPQNKNFVSVTDDLLNGDSNPNNDYQCVNLGVSAHYFNISYSNFDYFAEKFDEVDYAIIEVSSIDYSAEQLDRIQNKEYHSDMKERGTLYKLTQRIPYFRLLAKQLQDLQGGANLSNINSAGTKDYAIYQEKMNVILQDLAHTAKEHDIRLVILYHFPIKLNPDNTAQTGNDPKIESIFATCCKNNDIPFINMNETMIAHFESTYEPSYGFANSTPGTGHLNEVGHSLIAQEIYKEISKQTEEE